MQRNGLKSQDKDLSNDICPVCKSNRYLNPQLEFFINPECYHKMCSTCVDRIFSSGPASCPVPYCGKTLRKRGFHKAFFGDLKVEREVDIRKRVDAVFTRQADDFETLLDWNNYLEEVESLIFDLIEGTKEEKTRAEERLRRYRESRSHEQKDPHRLARTDHEPSRLRRPLLLPEPEDMKGVDASRRDASHHLATADDDAAKITAQTQRIRLSMSSARRNLTDSYNNDSALSGDSLTIHGLKKKEALMVEKLYDPFGGIDFTPSRYVLQDDYDVEWLLPAKRDERHMAGGYNLHEYHTRTMFEAFSGLGVFIEEEDPAQELASQSQTDLKAKTIPQSANIVEEV